MLSSWASASSQVWMCIFGRIQKCTKKIGAVKKIAVEAVGLTKILKLAWQFRSARAPLASLRQ